MDRVLNDIKMILDGEAGLRVENNDEILKLSCENNNVSKSVDDHRFEEMTRMIDVIAIKDEDFYTKIIQVLSIYIDKLYDREVDFCEISITNQDENMSYLDTVYFGCNDVVMLKRANRELAAQLFNYVCGILESNEEVKMDLKTLQRLFNRDPKRFSFSIEEDYVFRMLDFERLSKVIREHKTLEKSGISIEEIYQLLFYTIQLNNEKVFINLITPEQFRQNHDKIDEILSSCNAKTFVEVTNIILNHFDKNFDRFNVIKKRKTANFCESVIIELLERRTDEEDVSLIHRLLTDDEIEINYDLQYSDYFGKKSLKALLAFNGNRTLLRDLLSKEENVENYYHYGELSVPLYNIYARIGNYEKALELFQKLYKYYADYTEDWNDDFNRVGYTYGYYSYYDSVASFIDSMCASFREDDVDYETIKTLINRVFDSENVKYINLKETLSPIQEILSCEDYKALVSILLEKKKAVSLDFLVVREKLDMITRYVISIASEEEIQRQLSNLGKKAAGRSFINTKKDNQ